MRDQVTAREGITSQIQRLICARKHFTRGELTLRDYGVKQKSTLHVLGRVRGGMPETDGDGPFKLGGATEGCN